MHRRSDLLDVGGLGALLALSDFEADALILVQRAEAAALDGGVVNEEISAALVGGDESEALFSVEPLDDAFAQLGAPMGPTAASQLHWTLGVQKVQPTLSASVSGSRNGKTSLVDTDADLGLSRDKSPLGFFGEYSGASSMLLLSYDNTEYGGSRTQTRDIALSDFEADALILVQRAEAAALDGGVVNEEISAALVGGDESEALFSVEPLDDALSHDCFLRYVW